MTQQKHETILHEALDITSGDRNKYYGHPADNHGNTADFWSNYLQRKYGITFTLNSRDVCLMMVLLKISRDANAQKRDNLVDICGYTRNIEQITEREGPFEPAPQFTVEVRIGLTEGDKFWWFQQGTPRASLDLAKAVIENLRQNGYSSCAMRIMSEGTMVELVLPGEPAVAVMA